MPVTHSLPITRTSSHEVDLRRGKHFLLARVAGTALIQMGATSGCVVWSVGWFDPAQTNAGQIGEGEWVRSMFRANGPNATIHFNINHSSGSVVNSPIHSVEFPGTLDFTHCHKTEWSF